MQVLNGSTVYIFAYGMTGSGKTVTIEGVREKSLERLFDYLNNNREDFAFEVQVSLLEIRDNCLRDLLLEVNKGAPAECQRESEVSKKTELTRTSAKSLFD